jgi:phosphate transport system protein
MLHTDREYEAELARLRQQILLMGAKVEGSLELMTKALRQMDRSQAERVIAADEEIDQLELEIDEFCLKILARRQPVASDLRFITSTFRLVTDLERTADIAVNVAERIVELAAHGGEVEVGRNLVYMAELAQLQLHDALDSFVSGDVRRAEVVTERDSVVDSLYAQLFPELIAWMIRDPKAVEVTTRLQSIGKCLERIADHATNIAEVVIFMVQGKDIRHHSHATSLKVL